MGNIHLVTGYAGYPHVMASDQGAFNASVFGAGQYVLDRGNKLAASVITNNNVRIADGEIMMQGRHIRLAEGYVDLTIENGAQGKKRNDLIVARYTKDSISGVEDVNLVVIKGTAVDSNPVDPAYTAGDILNDNVLLNDMPLYRLPLDGLNVGTPVSLFAMYENPSTHATDKNNPHEVTIAQIGAAPAFPEMLFGVEYLTGERWNGNPVYTKLVDCGGFTTSGKTVTVTGLESVNMCGYESYWIGNTGLMLLFPEGYPDRIQVYPPTSSIIIGSSSDRSNGHLYVQLYYYK